MISQELRRSPPELPPARAWLRRWFFAVLLLVTVLALIVADVAGFSQVATGVAILALTIGLGLSVEVQPGGLAQSQAGVHPEILAAIDERVASTHSARVREQGQDPDETGLVVDPALDDAEGTVLPSDEEEFAAPPPPVTYSPVEPAEFRASPEASGEEPPSVAPRPFVTLLRTVEGIARELSATDPKLLDRAIVDARGQVVDPETGRVVGRITSTDASASSQSDPDVTSGG